ncbi:hypothetical protein H0H87_001737 [Tephrocybe sp. NHM501043]|nr:hypothetical protein H0H87_001737 [Tephrocybe sp. NHM501043]
MLPSQACPTVTPIADLPNEVLLLIFKYLYMKHRKSKPGKVRPEACYETDWDYQNPQSPSFFPNAQAQVSKRWRSIMSLCPAFWTRVVIFLDSPGCVPFAHVQLQSSEPLPMTIFVITRNPNSFSDSPEKESELASHVINTILPHLHRCTALEFDVNFSSSFPRLATDFGDVALTLERLSLRSSSARRLPGFIDGRTPSIFPFPLVRYLEIDGWNLVDIWTSAKWWLEELTELRVLQELYISHYHPDPDENENPRLILNDIFPLLAKLDPGSLLSFTNVNFQSTYQRMANGASLDFEAIQLSGIPSTLLKNIMCNVRHVRYLSITDSSLDGLQPSDLPLSYELELQDITDPYLSDQLLQLLPLWVVSEITVSRCPGLNDSVLNMLGRMNHDVRLSDDDDDDGDGERLNCPDLCALAIKDCSGVSVSALRSMVQQRMPFVVEHPWIFDYFTLDVQGGGLIPSQKEMEWFESQSADDGEWDVSDGSILFEWTG